MIVSSITSHTAPWGTAEVSDIKPASIDQGHYCLPKTEQLQTSEVPGPEPFLGHLRIFIRLNCE